MKTRSPREAIKAHCLHCTGNNRKEVQTCDGTDPSYRVCVFHPYRMGLKRPSVKIMRKFCLQCMGESLVMVKECETKNCIVHPFRFGKNPARIGKGQNAEQMAFVRSKKQIVSLQKSVQNQRSAIG